MKNPRRKNKIFQFKPVILLSQEERWRKQAELLKLSKQAKIRLEWIIFHKTKGNASLTCRYFGIAPKTFYKWQKIFDNKNLRLLEDRSKSPKRTRQRQITFLEEERIVKLRKEHLRWGKMKLQRLYLNIFNENISSWKIQYTIQKHKLYFHPIKNAKIQRKRLNGQKKKRITELKKQPFSGYLIALDTVVLYWNGAKRYILTAIDTVSKIAFARMYTTKSSKNAADFLRRFFYLQDGSFLNSLNDNGSEFHLEFIRACEELKINQYWSRNHTPEDNPVCERFNKTLQEEFIDFGNFTTDTVLFNRNLTEWLIEYNFVRPHETLLYDTPWQFYAKINKVLPMWSSRTFY
ncbi:DDE-type integrase/transposase/recombinase [Patescibacteria group bacterium]|nr:DDE-type integrase/transposase/recombinase [Patescibacteria group bacterium]